MRRQTEATGVTDLLSPNENIRVSNDNIVPRDRQQSGVHDSGIDRVDRTTKGRRSLPPARQPAMTRRLTGRDARSYGQSVLTGRPLSDCERVRLTTQSTSAMIGFAANLMTPTTPTQPSVTSRRSSIVARNPAVGRLPVGRVQSTDRQSDHSLRAIRLTDRPPE